MRNERLPTSFPTGQIPRFSFMLPRIELARGLARPQTGRFKLVLDRRGWVVFNNTSSIRPLRIFSRFLDPLTRLPFALGFFLIARRHGDDFVSSPMRREPFRSSAATTCFRSSVIKKIVGYETFFRRGPKKKKKEKRKRVSKGIPDVLSTTSDPDRWETVSSNAAGLTFKEHKG